MCPDLWVLLLTYWIRLKESMRFKNLHAGEEAASLICRFKPPKIPRWPDDIHTLSKSVENSTTNVSGVDLFLLDGGGL